MKRTDIKRLTDLRPGDILTVGPRHPHGPTKARILAMERLFGVNRPRCQALDKHGEPECYESEFFVIDPADVLQTLKSALF